jgi:hypothetical protein
MPKLHIPSTLKHWPYLLAATMSCDEILNEISWVISPEIQANLLIAYLLSSFIQVFILLGIYNFGAWSIFFLSRTTMKTFIEWH